MSITFKAFTTMLAEGKRAYSSEGDWTDDAQEAGYKVKKLSGDLMKGDQTWGAFNDKDEKVGEFTEEEGGRGGWLMEGQLTEIFGMFRNNEKVDKLKAQREKLKAETAEKVRKHRESQEEKRRKKDDDDDDAKDKDEREDKDKKRSGSTNGTRSTRSAAGGRAAERDWTSNMKEDESSLKLDPDSGEDRVKILKACKERGAKVISERDGEGYVVVDLPPEGLSTSTLTAHARKSGARFTVVSN